MRLPTRIVLLLTGVLGTIGSARAELQKAQDDLAVTSVGQAVLVNVLANDRELGSDLRILKAFKPANGSVAIENGQVRYTPKAGFQGSDSFRYMAQANKSQPAQATVSVEVGQGGVALRLVGQVVDDPIPGATVTVTIAGFNFAAVADANGRYVLDIAALRGDAFVTLVATGTSPSGAAVRFYSVVGEVVRLAAAAGDGVLVRDEFNQVNITNLSTAQYSLLAEANGGVPVGSDQQLLPLVQNIDLVEMLKLAAIIKLVVDEGVPLPGGTTDALALISDPAALQTFEASLAPNQLELAIDAVSQDANITPAFRAGALPTGYALIPPSAPGTIQPFAGVGALIAFSGSAGSTSGTGSNVDGNIESDSATTWALDNGDLVVTPVAPYVEEYVVDVVIGPTCPDYTGAGFDVQDTDGGVRLHRLQDGAGVDYLEVSSKVHRHYVDPDPADGCLPPTDSDVITAALRLAFEDGSGELPFALNESFGRIGLAQWVASENRWGASIYNFDTHTVSIPGHNAGFTSSANNGRLQLTITDNILGPINYEYRRYQSDGHKGEGLFATTTLPDGRKLASYNIVSRVDDSLVFDLATMPGTWRSGFDAAQFQGDGSEDIGFFVVLDGGAARTGHQLGLDAGGAVNNYVDVGWNIESGAMLARGYFDNSLPSHRQVSSCVSPNPTICWQRRQRTWIPVSRDGNRIYVLETVAFNFGGPTDPIVTGNGGERLNFYDLQPPETTAFQPGARPSGYALLPEPAAGTIQPFSYAGSLLMFSGNSNASSGSGTSMDYDPDSNEAATWALAGGDLVVTPATPYTTFYEDEVAGPDCPMIGVNVQESDADVRLHRLQDGAGLDTLQVFTTVSRHYVDQDVNDACSAPPDRLVVTTARRLAFEDGSNELPFAPAESFGRFALAQWVASENRWGAAIYNFDTHTVSIPGTAPAFTSGVSNGRLRVQLTDSTTAQVTNYEYRRYQSDGRKGEGLFVVSTLPDGRHLASYNLASRVDNSLAFDPATTPGVWRSGQDAAQTPGDGTDDTGFFAVFNGDPTHTGNQRSVDTLGTVDNNIGINWNVELGELVVRGYLDGSLAPGLRNVAYCASADPLVCWQRRQRSWVPISRDGNRIYVVETVSFRLEPTGALLTGEGGQRVNFWELQP